MSESGGLKVSLSDGLALAGLILAILIIVLDKAGKLKPGPMLFFLLAAAFAMTLPLALGNSWVADATPTMAKVARGLFLTTTSMAIFSAIGVWIVPAVPIADNSSKVPKILTLLDLFKTDFAGSDRLCADIVKEPITLDNLKTKTAEKVNIGVRYCVDYAAKSKFAAMYIPSVSHGIEGIMASHETYEVCRNIASNFKLWIPMGLELISQSAGERKVSSQGFRFGKLYVYHEDSLSYDQLARLEAFYGQHNLTP